MQRLPAVNSIRLATAAGHWQQLVFWTLVDILDLMPVEDILDPKAWFLPAGGVTLEQLAF
jgi:hypothetical protein